MTTPQNFSGQNLRGHSFKGQDLVGADFSGADIRGVNFANACLIGANFSYAQAGIESHWKIFLAIFSLFIAVVSGIISASATLWIVDFFTSYDTAILDIIPLFSNIFVGVVIIIGVSFLLVVSSMVGIIIVVGTMEVAIAVVAAMIVTAIIISIVSGIVAGTVAGTVTVISVFLLYMSSTMKMMKLEICVH